LQRVGIFALDAYKQNDFFGISLCEN